MLWYRHHYQDCSHFFYLIVPCSQFAFDFLQLYVIYTNNSSNAFFPVLERSVFFLIDLKGGILQALAKQSNIVTSFQTKNMLIDKAVNICNVQMWPFYNLSRS